MEDAAVAELQRVHASPRADIRDYDASRRAVPPRAGRYPRTNAVTGPESTGGHTAGYLRDHLPPELYERLASGGALPDDEVRAASARLRAELGAIATYIPSALVREQLADPAPGRVRGAYWDGSVLFADLSGFTALSGRLSALGKQGAEEVSAIINNLFGALVE
jgi:hypothetical protein